MKVSESCQEFNRIYMNPNIVNLKYTLFWSVFH